MPRREIPINPDKLPYLPGTPIVFAPSHPLPPEKQRLLNKALSLLSPREREVFCLSVGQCLSLSEIASLLGISKNSAAVYLRRARRKLQRFRKEATE